MQFLRKFLVIVGLPLLGVVAFVGWSAFGERSDRPISDTMGLDPVLAEPDPQTFPSIGLLKPQGWADGQKPEAAKGLVVSRFAEKLDHPRTMLTLPNGDVLVAETNSPPRTMGGIVGWVMNQFMSRVGAGDLSPDRIMLLRDGDGNGTAEQRFVLREADMASPSGMAFAEDKLYIANHDAVLAFAFEPGATRLEGKPAKLMDLPPGGNHWMRNLVLSKDGSDLYVAVGSASNIAENGNEEEVGRAAIWEIDLKTGDRRQFAAGMRNANGMAWNPSTGELWATVQERDMLGPDLVPDYLTNVPVGAHYGWPWVYFKDVYDDRVNNPMPLYLGEYVRKPEYALGAHVSVLGLLFSTGGNRMGERFANGAFVARHGSWNRRPPSGYDLIFVPFDERGNPRGKALTVLSGFLTKGGGKVFGRPTWLAWDKTGALLLSDDTAGIIWRVEAPGAALSQAPKPVVEKSLPPQRDLDASLDGEFRMRITKDEVIEQ
ncbi:MAG: sorbosone dehydrogenase family protein [Alphaproteobacteria bacterium]|nr:sorbosone dehydrogenase family protein [Alphaproteobacteria bacterium]